MKASLLYSLIGLLALIGAGCSITPAQQPALHDFGAPVSGQAIVSAPKAVITVDAPQWLQDTHIHYRLLYSSPTTVRSYLLDRWIAPPPELFQQRLIAGGLRPNYPLTIRLLSFEQQFDAPDRARVILHFSADAYSSDTKGPLRTQEFRLEQVTQTPDAAGAVTAFAGVARRAVEQVDRWLIELSDR
ncbi:MAG: ABC-type transport auxiliary lipoprotein family protein [Methylovulum sp.]